MQSIHCTNICGVRIVGLVQRSSACLHVELSIGAISARVHMLLLLAIYIYNIYAECARGYQCHDVNIRRWVYNAASPMLSNMSTETVRELNNTHLAVDSRTARMRETKRWR